MTITLRIALSIAILIYFVIVFCLLKSGKVSLKYTLLWLAMGIFLALLVIMPEILNWIRDLFGFELAINALLVGMIAFAFVLLMSLTSIVSKQSEKIRRLVQESAVLEKRIRELEDKK